MATHQEHLDKVRAEKVAREQSKTVKLMVDLAMFSKVGDALTLLYNESVIDSELRVLLLRKFMDDRPHLKEHIELSLKQMSEARGIVNDMMRGS